MQKSLGLFVFLVENSQVKSPYYSLLSILYSLIIMPPESLINYPVNKVGKIVPLACPSKQHSETKFRGLSYNQEILISPSNNLNSLSPVINSAFFNFASAAAKQSA